MNSSSHAAIASSSKSWLDAHPDGMYRAYMFSGVPTVSVSLTELRQQLFKLADQVVDTGVPLVIERRGVRLKLVRDDAPAAGGRLQRLKPQSLVQGAPLKPEESPALWSELPQSKAAEAAPVYTASSPRKPGKR